MLKNILIFICNLCLISSFIHNTNTFYKHSYNENYISKLKLSRCFDIDTYDLKYKHWKNIFKYLNNKTYNTNYCKWYYNKTSFNKTSFNSYYNLNYLTSFNYENNSILYTKLVNYNNFNYKKFKKINYHNNTYLYLIDNNIKLSISNSFNYIYNIDIIHPYHSNSRFSIKIIYNLISNDINSISLYRHYYGENYYWSNDNSINILHSDNFKSDFLFGRYISLDIPFKIYYYKNKLMLYNYKYPHLYEIKNSKDNIIFQLPDNIILDIPKLITSNEIFKIKLSWSFKDDTEINILDINYLNNTVNNVGLFTFV